MYIIFWRFPPLRLSFLSLPLPWIPCLVRTSALVVRFCCVVVVFDFLLCFYNLGIHFCAAVTDFLVVFVESFGQGVVCGSVFSISFMKSLLILVFFTFLLLGGLNQIRFHFLLFGLVFGGEYSSWSPFFKMCCICSFCC